MDLRKFRRAKGFTQKELAEIIGIDASSISKYESGSALPSFDVMEKLANILEVTTDTLYGRSEQCREDNEEKEILEYLKDNPEFKILFDRIKKGDKGDIQTLIAFHRAMKDTNINFRNNDEGAQ